jgi:hypothetical protein
VQYPLEIKQYFGRATQRTGFCASYYIVTL